MKLVVRVTKCDMAMSVGGDPELLSAIIEFDDEEIPDILKNYLKDPRFSTVSFSILQELEE